MIPTAEKLLANNIDGLRDALQDDDIYFFYKGVICEFAKGFAEMHIAEALKQASENVVIEGHPFEYELDKNSILSAYPLTNIK